MTKSIQILLGMVVGAEALFLGANLSTPNAHAVSPNAARVPVLVELYTSEGCSDCPPADKLLMDLEAKQPVDGAEIIVVGEHVDYWNHDGWKDRFSSAEITERQQAYSSTFHLESIYTPQMVVDGRSQFVGSNGREALKDIASAASQPHAEVAISNALKTSAGKNTFITFNVNVTKIQPLNTKEQLDVFFAVTESGLNSSVKAGENNGRELTHTGVLRKLTLAGKIGSKADKTFQDITVPMANDWNQNNLKLIVFVQGHSSRKIYSATSAKL